MRAWANSARETQWQQCSIAVAALRPQSLLSRLLSGHNHCSVGCSQSTIESHPSCLQGEPACVSPVVLDHTLGTTHMALSPEMTRCLIFSLSRCLPVSQYDQVSHTHSVHCMSLTPTQLSSFHFPDAHSARSMSLTPTQLTPSISLTPTQLTPCL